MWCETTNECPLADGPWDCKEQFLVAFYILNAMLLRDCHFYCLLIISANFVTATLLFYIIRCFRSFRKLFNLYTSRFLQFQIHHQVFVKVPPSFKISPMIKLGTPLNYFYIPYHPFGIIPLHLFLFEML